MKTIKFVVATDPALCGPDASPQDTQDDMTKVFMTFKTVS